MHVFGGLTAGLRNKTITSSDGLYETRTYATSPSSDMKKRRPSEREIREAYLASIEPDPRGYSQRPLSEDYVYRQAYGDTW